MKERKGEERKKKGRGRRKEKRGGKKEGRTHFEEFLLPKVEAISISKNND